MKFKVGDKVLVKSLEEINTVKSLHIAGTNFVPQMEQWCGKILQINHIDENGDILCNGCSYYWAEWMVEAPIDFSQYEPENMKWEERRYELIKVMLPYSDFNELSTDVLVDNLFEIVDKVILKLKG